jgi:hypothetical protein
MYKISGKNPVILFDKGLSSYRRSLPQPLKRTFRNSKYEMFSPFFFLAGRFYLSGSGSEFPVGIRIHRPN